MPQKDEKKTPIFFGVGFARLEFLPAGHLGLHLSRKARFQISFAFPGLEEDAGFVDASFETTERVIDGFVLTNNDFH